VECGASIFRIEEYAKQAQHLLTFTTILEEHTAPMFRVEEYPSKQSILLLAVFIVLSLKMKEACSSKRVINFY
jgi:hypothetical protein